MLVLSRKPGERIFIGDGADAVIITVVKIGPNQVRLGIEAPQDKAILREEVMQEQLNRQPENSRND